MKWFAIQVLGLSVLLVCVRWIQYMRKKRLNDYRRNCRTDSGRVKGHDDLLLSVFV
jgi:hypothetical protein